MSESPRQSHHEVLPKQTQGEKEESSDNHKFAWGNDKSGQGRTLIGAGNAAECRYLLLTM